MNNELELTWNFEAFRKFITFQAVQNAASVVSLFDGTNIKLHPNALLDFQSMLKERSGLVWEPTRQNSEDIIYNSEGNVFRNKARVLSSLFLINPFSLKNDDVLSATDFCKALASGKISEEAYFEYIIKSFEYPHPAYEDNWREWTSAGIKLKPFVFTLQILVALFESNQSEAFLTIDEFARFAHPKPYHDKVSEIASSIISFRVSPENTSDRVRSDKIDRKIGDLFGFLCLSPFAYYDGNKIRLNLIRRHPEEKVYFFLSRREYNVLDQIKLIINE